MSGKIATRLVIALSAMVFSFLWGAATFRLHVFPYGIYEYLYIDRISPLIHANAEQPQFMIYRPKAEAIADLHGHVQREYKQIRDYLLSRTIIKDYGFRRVEIGDSTISALVAGRVNDGNEVYEVQTYGVRAYGVLARAGHSGTRKLLIYHQGHGGAPEDFDYFDRIKQSALKRGYDVLSLSMPSFGYNIQDQSFPARGGPLFIPRQNQSHEIYALFNDPQRPQLTPLSIMLSGNYHLVDEVIKTYGYDHVVMTGVSGGGWFTTMLSALIPEITDSISFAGTMPLYLRGVGETGDWEQVGSEIWQEFDYWTFYFLATLDREGGATRTHAQAYNDRDPCCFGGKSADEMMAFAKTLAIPNFRVLLVSSNRHQPDLPIIESELLK